MSCHIFTFLKWTEHCAHYPCLVSDRGERRSGRLRRRVERRVPCSVRRGSTPPGDDASQLVSTRSSSSRSWSRVLFESIGASQRHRLRRQTTFRCHLVRQHGRQLQNRKCSVLRESRRNFTWYFTAWRHSSRARYLPSPSGFLLTVFQDILSSVWFSQWQFSRSFAVRQNFIIL